MGMNTVVLVLNDALNDIRGDINFGISLAAAISEIAHREVPAFSPNGFGVFCNAATVVSTSHCDVPQVVVVKHNTGYTYSGKEPMPDHAIEDLKWVLEQHGYSVRKKRKKEGDESLSSL